MTGSDLLDPLFHAGLSGDVFSARARVQAMLDFEAALARAEAEVGVIPAGAAAPITASCRVERFDLAELADQAAAAGNLAIPLVKALSAEVRASDPEAANYVHWGATSQDVIDSGTMLQLRRALDVIDEKLARSQDALAELARRERRTVMAGRTFLQHAVPVTLGLKAAGWLSAVARARARLTTQRAALCLQFGGAAGNLSALGDRGMAVAEALARELALVLPDLPWHGQRDRIAELGAALGIAIGSLGKLARDLSLLMQTEVQEAREPSAPGRGGSSTMPHKQNPVACTVALAAAVRAPGLVSTLLSAMVQEHERGLGGWHAEWETLPNLCALAAGAAEAMAGAFEGIRVDGERMRANLALSGGALYAEAVSVALSPKLGKARAQALVEACSHEALARGESLRAALGRRTELAGVLDERALDELFSPEHRLGANDALIARALAASGREES